MELPKLIYDDFYKFLMSLGTVLFIISGAGIFVFKGSSLNIGLGLLIGLIIIFVISVSIMVLAGKKWYQNQKLLDQKLKAEVNLIEQEAQKTLQPINESTIDSNNSALVNYQIASVLPGAVYFNFLEIWQVWFLIQNQLPQSLSRKDHTIFHYRSYPTTASQ